MVLYGMDTARVAYIISDNHTEVIAALSREVDRGVTILRGTGAYTGAEKNVLMVAFKQRQIVGLKKAIKDVDPTAFVIVCQANEVLGSGFASHHDTTL